MDEQWNKGKAARGFVRLICFAAFGAVLYTSPLEPLNPFSIGFGVVVGLVFGWLFKLFLKGFLSLFNGSVKKEKGQRAISYAVENGMLYLVPFAMMALLATYYLSWSMTAAFVSTGIMAVGTASAIELGKLMEKPSVKNTIIASGVSFLFSFSLTLTLPILARFPGLIEGVFKLIPTMLGQGGGSL